MTHRQLLAMAANENAALLAENHRLAAENERLRAAVDAGIGRPPVEPSDSTDVQFRSAAVRSG